MSSSELAALNKRTKPVTIDDQTLHVRKISGAQAMLYHHFTEAKPDGADAMAKLLQLALSDKAGVRVYDDGVELAVITAEVPFDAMMILFEEASVFNKLKETKEDKPGNSPAAS